MVDALVSGGDEGRGRLRYAAGSRQTGIDPRISEWGNPPEVMLGYPLRRRRTGGTETSKYPEEEKAIAIPPVAASEQGTAQTERV